MAWNDVLKGPEFFAENPDAAAQRAAVKALYKVEAWKPISELDLTERRRFWAGDAGTCHQVLSLDAEWPSAAVLQDVGQPCCLAAARSQQLCTGLGSIQITYLNSTRDKAYTVQQSKIRFCALSATVAVADAAADVRLWRLAGQIPQGLCRDHRAEFLAKGAEAGQEACGG